MAHEIVERTVNTETDKRALVDNLHPPLVRKMAVGSDWTKLRIGMRVSSRRSTAWSSPPYFYFGLCAGLEAPPGSATPNHFVGIRSSGVNWDVSSGNPSWFPNNSNSFGRCMIQDGATSYTAVSASGNPSYIWESSQGRTCIFLDLTKGATWTITPVIQYASNSFALNATADEFRALMEVAEFSSPLLIRGEGTMSVDESTYGELDSVCFAFLGSTDGFEVSDIAYAVLA